MLGVSISTSPRSRSREVLLTPSRKSRLGPLIPRLSLGKLSHSLISNISTETYQFGHFGNDEEQFMSETTIQAGVTTAT